MASVHSGDSKQPYVQILDELRRAIVRGDIEPNGKLPSNAELKRKYQVASQTAQNAINALKAEGLVYGVAGKGVFVRADVDLEALRSSRLRDVEPVQPEIGYLVDQVEALTKQVVHLRNRIDQIEGDRSKE